MGTEPSAAGDTQTHFARVPGDEREVARSPPPPRQCERPHRDPGREFLEAGRPHDWKRGRCGRQRLAVSCPLAGGQCVWCICVCVCLCVMCLCTYVCVSASVWHAGFPGCTCWAGSRAALQPAVLHVCVRVSESGDPRPSLYTGVIFNPGFPVHYEFPLPMAQEALLGRASCSHQALPWLTTTGSRLRGSTDTKPGRLSNPEGKRFPRPELPPQPAGPQRPVPGTAGRPASPGPFFGMLGGEGGPGQP